MLFVRCSVVGAPGDVAGRVPDPHRRPQSRFIAPSGITLCRRPIRAALLHQRRRATSQLARRRCDCDCSRRPRVRPCVFCVGGSANRRKRKSALGAPPTAQAPVRFPAAANGRQLRSPTVAVERPKLTHAARVTTRPPNRRHRVCRPRATLRHRAETTPSPAATPRSDPTAQIGSVPPLHHRARPPPLRSPSGQGCTSLHSTLPVSFRQLPHSGQAFEAAAASQYAIA